MLHIHTLYLGVCIMKRMVCIMFIFLLVSLDVVISCAIAYRQNIPLSDSDFAYCEGMRKVVIKEKNIEKLYYYQKVTDGSKRIIEINSGVLKSIVYDNIYETIYNKGDTNPLFCKMVPEHLFKNCYEVYYSLCSELKNFPLAIDKDKKMSETLPYENSWAEKRTYGGDRKHEGTDIFAANNKRGYYPVLSVCDGTVENIGWLNLGGYRVGIRGSDGAYYYYAHLAGYAEGIKKGKQVKAGEVLGTMGDTGYSEVEGTTGNFDVHLHFGIYVNKGKEEISYNPYYLLRALEQSRHFFAS